MRVYQVPTYTLKGIGSEDNNEAIPASHSNELVCTLNLAIFTETSFWFFVTFEGKKPEIEKSWCS